MEGSAPAEPPDALRPAAAPEATEGGRTASQIKRDHCDAVLRKLADKPSLKVLVGLNAKPLDEPGVVAARTAVLSALPEGSATDIESIGASLFMSVTVPALRVLCASPHVTMVREPDLLEPGATTDRPAAPIAD